MGRSLAPHVGSYDGSTIRLYVDGSQVGTGTSYPGALTYNLPNSNDLEIGNYPGVCRDSRVFDGDIDDVEIFNQALTPDQVDGFGQSHGIDLAVGLGRRRRERRGGGGGASTPPTTGGQSSGALDHLAEVVIDHADDRGQRPPGHRARPPGGDDDLQRDPGVAAVDPAVALGLGRAAGRRCVRPAAGHRARSQCAVFVVIDSYMRSDPAGPTTLRVARLVAG